MINMNVWMLHLGTNFSCKKFGLQRHNGDLLTWKIKRKKTHLKYRSFFGERYEKQRNLVWKMHAFRLVNIVAFTALVQLNNLYNNRFFNAYSMGCLSPTLIKGLLKGCEGNYSNSDSNVYLTLQYWCLGLVEHHVQRHHVTQLYLYR